MRTPRRDVLQTIGVLLLFSMVPTMPGWGVSSDLMTASDEETWFRSYRVDPDRVDGLAWAVSDLRQYLANTGCRLRSVKGYFIARLVHEEEAGQFLAGPPDFMFDASILSAEEPLYAAFARGGQRWTYLRFELVPA